MRSGATSTLGQDKLGAATARLEPGRGTGRDAAAAGGTISSSQTGYRFILCLRCVAGGAARSPEARAGRDGAGRDGAAPRSPFDFVLHVHGSMRRPLGQPALASADWGAAVSSSTTTSSSSDRSAGSRPAFSMAARGGLDGRGAPRNHRSITTCRQGSGLVAGRGGSRLNKHWCLVQQHLSLISLLVPGDL